MDKIGDDIEAMDRNTFSWLDIDAQEIDMKANLISKFHFNLSPARLNLLNTNCIEEIYSLMFIDSITSTGNITDNSKNFIEVLRFDDKLLEYFMKYFIETDLVNLDKIDAVNLESLHPIARNNIRRKNFENQDFQNKYFKRGFNLFNFAIKLINRYVPIKSYQIKHKTHIYGLSICKYLIEYGMIDDDQISRMSQLIYEKLQNFKKFEDDINKKDLEQAWVDDVIQIRKCYSEIMIHILYIRQDVELLSILRNITDECPTLDNYDLISSKIKYSDGTIFEPDIGKKILEIVLGYILSQEKIKGEVIAPKEILEIVDNYLMVFSNMTDPFLLSINIMQRQDIISFFNKTELPSQKNLLVIEYSNEIHEVKESIFRSEHASIVDVAVRNLSNILEKFNSVFEINFEEYNEENLKGLQRALNKNNIFVQFIMILDGLNAEVLTLKFINYFSKFCKIFLYENTETQCIFLQEYYFSVIRKLIDKFPEEILNIINDVFYRSPRTLLANSEFLFFFIKYHEQYRPESLVTMNEKSMNLSTLILKILKIYITDTRKKDFIYLPEYDILIGDYLGSLFGGSFHANDIKEILLNEDKYQAYHRSHVLLYVELLTHSIEYRFTRKTYDLLGPTMTFEYMKEIVASLKDYETQGIFHEFFTHVNIDFKNNLLNQRNGFYIKKPVDMQYDEDIMVLKPYNDYIEFYLEEIDKILLESQKPENESQLPKMQWFMNNFIFLPLFKAFNLFSYIRDIDIGQLKEFIPSFEKCDKMFFHEIDRFEKFYKVQLFSQAQLNEKIDKEMNLEKTRDAYLKEKLYIRHLVTNVKIFIIRHVKLTELRPMRARLVSEKPTTVRVERCKIDISLYSNLLEKRSEAGEIFLEREREKMKRKNIDIIRMLGSYYRIFKHEKLSSGSGDNIYINTLNEKDSPDAQLYAYNLCFFIHNQLKQDYTYGYKTYFYMLVESFTNVLFVATKSIQINFYKIIKETDEWKSLDKIFLQMKFIMNYIKHKNSIDKYYKETYSRALLCLKFHQFICEDNFIDFKALFKDKNLPDDSVDRVQRFTTIYQRTTDLCEYHTNYDSRYLTTFTERNRPHLLLMCAYTFDCLAEFTAGPYEPNQLKIYRFIYDRYNGTLKRYMVDPDSPNNTLKESLCDFMIAMADGLNDEIVTFLTINYEIKTIGNLMTNSVIQLYNEYKRRKKEKGKSKKIHPVENVDSELTLVEDFNIHFYDYPILLAAFKEDTYFNTHTLLEISIKMFKFLNYVANVRAKFQMFIDDRNYAIKGVENMIEKAISEKDLVVWKFLKKIVTKMEFLNESEELDEIFYTKLPKCFYLSKETKLQFFDKEADRTSLETKITSLTQRIPLFEEEMNFNLNAFQSNSTIYSLFTANSFYYLQIICLIFGVLINAFMMADFKNRVTPENFNYIGDYEDTIKALAITQICVSFACLLIWIKFKFSLIYTLTSKNYFILNDIKEEETGRWTQLKIFFYHSFFNQDVPMVYLFHVIMPILGLTLSVGFYGIDLLAIINLTETFKYIVKSITLHFDQLIATYILGVIIMLVYSIFIHSYWVDSFNDLTDVVGGPSKTENGCINLVRCFWGVLKDGFKNGEGIRALMNNEHFGSGNANWYFARLFAELSFFLIINITLLNIIFGITIDTFASMRDKRQKFDFDSQNFCYICHNQKYVFEKSGIRFRDHIYDEHNLWSYVYFIVLMRSRTTKDCNTKEAFLLDNINSNNIEWIPMYRSISLEKVNALTGETSYKDVEKRLKNVNALSDTLTIKLTGKAKEGEVVEEKK